MIQTKKDKILELYRRGYTTNIIAKMLNTSESSVVLVLEDYGYLGIRRA